MPSVYCVRANYGQHTAACVKGGFIGIDWIGGVDLSTIKSKDELYPIYRAQHPDDTSNLVVGQQVGQIARFLFEIQPGDFIVTPDANSELLRVAIVEPSPSYVFSPGNDGFPYRQRRRVKWLPESFKRGDFSVPLQNTLRSSLTVFSVTQKDDFFKVIGRKDLVSHSTKKSYDPYETVLERLLELNDKEFEILITHLLSAMGFEGAEHVGKVGDGGVDATGELNMSNLAKIKLFVQVKRYKLGVNVSAAEVKSLRQSIPSGVQGAFITTAEFHKKASDIALEQGFPRIGLVNGHQVVDLLVEHWPDIPEDFKLKLELKPGLVRS